MKTEQLELELDMKAKQHDHQVQVPLRHCVQEELMEHPLGVVFMASVAGVPCHKIDKLLTGRCQQHTSEQNRMSVA